MRGGHWEFNDGGLRLPNWSLDECEIVLRRDKILRDQEVFEPCKLWVIWLFQRQICSIEAGGVLAPYLIELSSGSRGLSALSVDSDIFHRRGLEDRRWSRVESSFFSDSGP